jgi:integrase
VDNGLSPSTIKNYISACNCKFKKLSIDTVAFQSNLLKLALRSLEINTPTRYKPKPIINIQQLVQLLTVMQSHPLYVFFRVAILFAYFGMLRISNVTALSVKNFDVHRHLVRGDVTLHHASITIYLKWSKSMQTYRQASIVKLPQIPNSILCPFQAYQTLCNQYPLSNNHPLLSYSMGSHINLVSKTTIQNMLKQAVTKANLHPQITFHCFRRSSASLAFAGGIPLKHIQAHGTWASNSVWAYIDSSAKAALLPNFFKTAVLSTPTAFGCG